MGVNAVQVEVQRLDSVNDCSNENETQRSIVSPEIFTTSADSAKVVELLGLNVSL